MTRWQRRARLFIAVFAVIFAVAVFFAFRRRPAAPVSNPVVHLEPKAIAESAGGHVVRMKGTREDVAIDFEKEVTYQDGSSKLLNVKVTATDRRDGRVFTLTGKEGHVSDNPATYTVRGDVRLAASDGLTAATDRAEYADATALVQAPGPARFAKGRFAGTGVGMTYDKNRDTITILDQAVVHIAPDEKGSGAAEVTAASAVFARREKYMRFDRDVKVVRGGQTTEADQAIAHLSDDEKRIDTVELHGNARITESAAAAGALQALSGSDMTLKYGRDGETLEHALISGGATIQLAGDAGTAGRRIEAKTLDVTLAADGSTPTALAGREGVQLTLPPEEGPQTPESSRPSSGARTIRAQMMDARGEAGRGLTDASFVGNVDYREAVSAARPSTSSGRAEPGPGRALREARSNALEVALRPGMSAIDEARFSGVVRFEEGALAATGATARYLVDRGIVELRGGDGPMIPHVVNPQIAVDAAAIDLTFLGPKMKATGSVKSLLKPEAAGAEKGQTRMPAMLKQDQPVNVVSDALAYDGTVSTARYSGNAQLWQGDTSIRAPSIDIDARSGDLAADGADGTVTTSVMLDQTNATTKAQERVRSLGTSKAFKYDDGARRATYTGDAHLSGPEGDLTAPKIELYLKPSGNELERAEAYEEVTLRESGRTTTGTRMTYFADTERYLVVGSPVKVVDECGGETVGRTLTFDKNADTIVLDGRKQFRTQSKGASKCG